MTWHTLELDENSTSDTICAKLVVGSDSYWFSGHFPDEPILPGIALLSMVHEAIREATGCNSIVRDFRKIRFKQVIKPGDRIFIKAVRQEDPRIYTFDIQCHGMNACKGTLTLESV